MGEPASSEGGRASETRSRYPDRRDAGAETEPWGFTAMLQEHTDHVPPSRRHRRVGRATLGCGGFWGARLARPHPWGAPLDATRSAPN